MFVWASMMRLLLLRQATWLANGVSVTVLELRNTLLLLRFMVSGSFPCVLTTRLGRFLNRKVSVNVLRSCFSAVCMVLRGVRFRVTRRLASRVMALALALAWVMTFLRVSLVCRL